ncbi:flagellar basal body rod protein FlgC [Butyrivibrio sp. VCB2006]|uniref:flagellar basal body rod protein FlgC n=1 Tax=Butyrivibrio sp. VCB2006 TaxID=1280679 RepID=UPI00040E6D07|nr:flagellar basal body rod protein FlgC [Butyrivibrio sp. VCB2006]
MNIFDSFNINSSGMTAQRFRMDIISENIANANTTRTKDGEHPYTRKVVRFAEKGTQTPFSRILNERLDHYSGRGVKVVQVQDDTWTQYNVVYDPSHPDADENGYVTYPNVNTVTEMTNLIDASRSYEANATAFNASKNIATRGLELGQG